MSYHDRPVVTQDMPPVPVFSWSTTVWHHDILIPNYVSFGEVPPTSNDLNIFSNATQWEKREARAIWRGTTAVPGGTAGQGEFGECMTDALMQGFYLPATNP